MTRRTISLAVGLALVGTLLCACGRTDSGQPTTASGTAISSLGLSVFAVADRPELPTLSGVTLDGGYVDVAAMRGKVVVINAWASWCAPCKEELPVLVQLARGVGPDVEFVGLDVNDRLSDASEMASAFAIPYPTIVDRGAALLLTIPTVPPEAVPSTVIIDKQGRVAARVIGTIKPGMLEPVIAAIAAE